MKQMKTDWRCKLKSTSLTDLMTIVMYSPNVSQFDPIPSLDHWFQNEGSDRCRRPKSDTYVHSDTESDSDSEY